MSDIIYDKIKEAILSGKIPPGSRLKQIEISQQLGVSQHTVREAFKQLVYSGWVVQKPNYGFTVSEISFREQDELVEMRKLIEVYAFEKAVDKLTDADLARMRYLVTLADYSSNEILANPKTIDANFEFHMIPVKAHNNSYMTRTMEDIWSRLWVYHFRTGNDEDYKKSSLHDLEEHTKILEAFEKRDPNLVREYTTNHANSAIATLWKIKNIMKGRGK